MNCHKCGKKIELIDLYAQNHKFFCHSCFEKITNKKEKKKKKKKWWRL